MDILYQNITGYIIPLIFLRQYDSHAKSCPKVMYHIRNHTVYYTLNLPCPIYHKIIVNGLVIYKTQLNSA